MAESNQQRPVLFFWLAFLSTFGAIINHAYLAYHHYTLKYSHHSGSMCNISEYFNCADASASPYSEMFGMPLAVLGAVLNGALFLLICSEQWPSVSDKVRQKLPASVLWISLFVLLTSVVMAYLSFAVIETACPFCMLAYALSLITFVAVLMYYGPQFRVSLFEVKTLAVIGGATLVCSFFFHAVSLSKYPQRDTYEKQRLKVLNWKEQPTVEMNLVNPTEMNDPEKATMKMVEFADFLCPHCAVAFPKVHSFAKSHPDVHLAFQAYPIDGACNASVSFSDGTRCLLARMSYCGNKQSKGWATQKWIFDHQHKLVRTEAVKGKLDALISEVQLDGAQFKDCIESEDAHQTIKGQVEVGNKAGVKGTPALFVNGKRVPGVSLPVLKSIYSEIKSGR